MPHKRIVQALKKRKRPKIPKLPKLPRIPIPPIRAGLPPAVSRGITNILLKPRPGVPLPVAVAWGLAQAYHYGTHPEVRDWWERRGEQYQEWRYPDVPTAIDPESPWDIPEGWGVPAMPSMPETPTKASTPTKRRISQANKATSRAYKFLRAGVKGKLTQKKCCVLLKKAQMLASKANPNTKSRIGKGNTKNLKECRRMRKSIWGTNKRN